MSNGLEVLRENSVAVVRFSRPEIRNPLSRDIISRLYEVVDELADNTEIEKLVFTGSGDAFASGANLNEIADVTPTDAPEFAKFGQSLMQKIEDLSQLTIAAINGYCFGGALDLALACNLRVASRTATFAHPGAGLGIITGWGGTQRLPRLIGTANALEMFFTASAIDARRASEIGLVDLVADDIFKNELLDLSSDL